MANSTDRRTPELAPPWLSRAQRRYVDRALRKLIRRSVCSLCGGAFRHNSPTATGFDTQNNVALACEGCIGRLAEVFAMGFYLSPERSAEAFATHIADTDQLLADIERRGGVGYGMHASKINFSTTPWIADDDDWFTKNPSRSHHVRMPFPGECDEKVAMGPAGTALVILVRQVDPRTRLRAGAILDTRFLPVPDDEATGYAWFEVAMGRETVPHDDESLRVLIEKYKMESRQ
jgi:hypothetical protein